MAFHFGGAHGQTNLVVAIGRTRLLVAISGALRRRGLLVAVARGP